MTDPNAEARELWRLAQRARDRGDLDIAELYDELADLARAGRLARALRWIDVGRFSYERSLCAR